jgi:hypothetical protein
MEAGGQATCYRYPFGQGGWHVSDFDSEVFASSLIQNEGFDGFSVSWKPYVVVSQQ